MRLESVDFASGVHAMSWGVEGRSGEPVPAVCANWCDVLEGLPGWPAMCAVYCAPPGCGGILHTSESDDKTLVIQTVSAWNIGRGLRQVTT